MIRAFTIATLFAAGAAAAQGDPPPRTPAGSNTVIAAGDIAQCRGEPSERRQAAATAALIERLPGTVLALGDLAYRDGSAREFRDCYDPTWGRFKARTWPVPGNHEYRTPQAAPYFDYWGSRVDAAGEGYYAVDVGAWRMIALNSNIDAGPGSPQMLWLARELAQNRRTCTLAFWHHPRFSSGSHGDNPHMETAWQLLHAAGAEPVLSGHDHLYERFAPLNAQGEADPKGLRQFIVGTGGAALHAFKQVRAGSELRGIAFGVLVLTLDADRYAWEFVSVAGQALVDRGVGTCRD